MKKNWDSVGEQIYTWVQLFFLLFHFIIIIIF